jgi:hypothetical protein
MERSMMKSIAVAIAFFLAMPSLPSVAQPRYDYGPGGNPYPRTYPGPPRGTPYWSGYVDAPVGEAIPPCHWITQRFWDGQGWRERRVRICGVDQAWPSSPSF